MDNLKWFKSTRSNGSGACVEVAHGVSEPATFVRDTKDRLGGTLAASPAAWQAFVDVVKAGRV